MLKFFQYEGRFPLYHEEAPLLAIDFIADQLAIPTSTWFDTMTAEDLRALSSLIYAHVNPYGRFELDMSARLALDAALVA